MKKLILSLTASLLCVGFSYAQMNTRVIGTDRNETATHVRQLSDGSTIIGGIMYDNVGGTITNSDVFILRLDPSNNLQWVRTFGGSDEEFIQDMIITQGSEDIVFVANSRANSTPANNGNTAYIHRLDNNGTTQSGSTFRELGNASNIAGEIFWGVTELNNGNLAVVGTRNFTGGASGGLICVYDASCSLLYHELYDVASASDEYTGVVTDGTDIYISGFVKEASNSHDFRVAHYTPGSGSGTMHYDNRYDFTISSETNNYGSDIYLESGTLIINGVISTPCCALNDNKQAIIKVDASTGNVIGSTATVINTGSQYANSVRMVPLSSDRVFFTQNPSTGVAFDPFAHGFLGTVNAVVGDLTLSTGTANLTKQFNNTGDQAILDVIDNSGVLKMVGSINGASVSFGNRDIYFVTSNHNLTDTREECEIDDLQYTIQTPTITASSVMVNSATITIDAPMMWAFSEWDMNFDIICGDPIVPPSGDPCNEDCYWTLLGNSNIGANNFIGSINNAELRFRTVNQERGIFDTEGDFGINLFQTGNLPDAKLHVFCDLNEEHMQGHSNVRFEELMEGEGHYLVIDDAGYVYKTADIPGGGGGDDGGSDSRIAELEQKVEQLQEQLQTILNHNNGDIQSKTGSIKLFPNPTDGKVTLEYDLPQGTNSAVLMITDVTGRTVSTMDIDVSKKSMSFELPSTTTPGELLCTIVNDGQTLASRTLVYTK